MIIALGYKKHSGKDAVARYICQGYGFRKLAIAYRLKLAVAALYGFSEAQLNNQEAKEIVDEYWGISPREATQNLSDKLDSEHLIKALRLHQYDNINLVISDVRSRAQFDYLQSIGAYCINIDRPIQHANEHKTETELDTVPVQEWDYWLHNDSTVDKLYNKVDAMMLTFGVIKGD